MKIKVNYSTIFLWLWEKKWNFLFFIAVCFQLYLLKYDIHSVKFLPRLVSLIFIALSLNAVLFTTFFLIFRRREFYKPCALALICADAAIYVTLNYPTVYDYFGVVMDTLLVKKLIPVHFVQVAVSDGNLFWSLMLGLYISIFLFVYGNWFIRNKKLDDGFWKIERQFFYTGLGLYGILVPFIFIFTHFTFVGSNYLYMEGLLKYTDKVVAFYDKENRQDNFQLKDLHYFPTLDSALKFYQDKAYVARIITGKNSYVPTKEDLTNPLVERSRIISGDNKADFYMTSMDKLQQLKDKGFENPKKLTYETITRFHDWVQVAYNVSFNGQNQEHQKLWYQEITPTVLQAKEQQEDVLRHSILYVQKAHAGGYYIYFTLDRTFKDHKMNYIFNFFFVLFHVLYISFFIYLLNLHKKKNLSKKYKPQELHYE